jgi:hypothetical protein
MLDQIRCRVISVRKAADRALCAAPGKFAVLREEPLPLGFRTRTRVAGAVLVAAAFALAACSSAPAPTKIIPTTTPTVTRTKAPTATPTVTPTPEAPRSRHPNALIYLTGREPDTLDPHVDYTSAGAGVLHNVYETLVTYDKADPSKFVQLLAEYVPEAVAAGDGSVTYTFVIPDGIKFHQGGEVSAEDVAYSLWRTALLGRTDRAGSIFDSSTRTPGFLLLDALLGVDDAALLVDASGKFVGDPEFMRMAKADALRAACEQVKAAITFDNWGRSVTLKLPRPYAPLMPVLATPGASIVSKRWMIDQGEWDGDCQTWQYFYGLSPAPSDARRRSDRGRHTRSAGAARRMGARAMRSERPLRNDQLQWSVAPLCGLAVDRPAQRLLQLRAAHRQSLCRQWPARRAGRAVGFLRRRARAPRVQCLL